MNIRVPNKHIKLLSRVLSRGAALTDDESDALRALRQELRNAETTLDFAATLRRARQNHGKQKPVHKGA